MMRIVKLLCVDFPSILEEETYSLTFSSLGVHNYFRNLS